jgi:hypothetical protein
VSDPDKMRFDGIVERYPPRGASRPAVTAMLNGARADGAGADAGPTGDSRKPAPGPVTFTAADLKLMIFPPIKWVVPRFITEGLTIFAGNPKIGKSWFMYDVAIAVAAGRFCLGDIKPEQGDVLYLALEDNQRRLQTRMRKILGAEAQWPERLHLCAMSWPQAPEGVNHIRAWLKSVDKPRLVVIDVLTKFRAPPTNRDNPYQSDYASMTGLQELALEFGVAIVVVHHTRKSTADSDTFEEVSGTMGLTGGADTTIVLKRKGGAVVLYGRGRDVEEFEVAATFTRETCRWAILGVATDVLRTNERTVILKTLAENSEGMTPAEMADATGRSRNSIKQLLYKMAKSGEVSKTKKGRYFHLDHPPPL